MGGSQDAVSSVVGTVLMLGVTMTVFAGVSIVVLAEFDEANNTTRADLQVLTRGETMLIRHGGGDAIGLAQGYALVNVSGSMVNAPLTDFAGQVGDPWVLGNSLCVSCAFSGHTIGGVILVHQNTVLASFGQSGGPPPTTTDLRVAVVNTSPAVLGEGDTVTLSAYITNDGQALATDRVVSFRIDGSEIGRTTTSGTLAFAKGEQVTLPWTAVYGSHTFEAFVDPDNTLDETDETDNALSTTLTVVGVADPGFAFEDVDHDGLYASPVDNALNAGQLVDGVHDATPSSLVIPSSVGTLTAATFQLSGEGIRVDVDLTSLATNIELTAAATLELSTTITSATTISLTGGTVDATDSTLDATGAVTINGNTIFLDGAQSTSGDLAVSGGTVQANGAQFTAQGTATITGSTLDLSGATLAATQSGDGITMTGSTLVLDGADFTSSGPVAITSSGAASGMGLALETAEAHEITWSSTTATLSSSTWTARAGVTVTGTDVVLNNAVWNLLTAGSNLLVAATDLSFDGAEISGQRDVQLQSAGDATLIGAKLWGDNKMEVQVGGNTNTIYLDNAEFRTVGGAPRDLDTRPNGAIVIGTPAVGGYS